jgi:hypothetical protein
MSPGGMVCHLSDSFRFALGERPVADISTSLTRTLVRWLALHTPLPWPKGVQTRPEIDQKANGTRPKSLAADRAQLLQLMRRFAYEQCERPPHPFFGRLKEEEWQHWAWRHVDHHLRQFGL